MNKIYISDSAEETQEIAENFVKRLKKGDVVALYGNLGSGKTTFVQGLARGFGIKKRIISPTFIIVRTYKIKTSPFAKASEDRQKPKSLCHIDLYRVNNKNDIEGLGLMELFETKDNVVVIEWAEKMQNLLPKKRWDVKFEDLGGRRRKITINQKL